MYFYHIRVTCPNYFTWFRCTVTNVSKIGHDCGEGKKQCSAETILAEFQNTRRFCHFYFKCFMFFCNPAFYTVSKQSTFSSQVRKGFHRLTHIVIKTLSGTRRTVDSAGDSNMPSTFNAINCIVY